MGCCPSEAELHDMIAEVVYASVFRILIVQSIFLVGCSDTVLEKYLYFSTDFRKYFWSYSEYQFHLENLSLCSDDQTTDFRKYFFIVEYSEC